MDSYENSTSSNYQTVPPTTVMMAGNIKEDSPMRIDEDVANSNSNNGMISVSGINASRLDNTNDFENIFTSNDRLHAGAVSKNGGSVALHTGSSEQDPQIEKKPGSNVIVDESPLQLQMEKNKECKCQIIVL